jgi:glutamyl-Q tRNA(Asp) synthetase
MGNPTLIGPSLGIQTASPYRGRFAPSPTGPLHFGSLVAAVGSYLEARTHNGEWLLRIEDLDRPRTIPGAAEQILRTLEDFGFAWDGPVIHQSSRLDLYRTALVRLQRNGDVFPCACSRREIEARATAASVVGGWVYPGTCRAGLSAEKSMSGTASAWRLRVSNGEIAFDDRIQGAQTQNLESDVGDFVLLRADGQFAYQLAVVVDDAWQGVNAVVRGADLLDSTPRQIWLQQRLGYATPSYAHLPVATNAAGEKLSKQTLAAAVTPANAVVQLCAVMRFLGQKIPAEMLALPLAEFWPLAISIWSPADVPALRRKLPCY